MSSIIWAHPAPPRHRFPHPLALTRAGISGFPSPAEDYQGRTLDLNEHIVKRPSSTFFTTVDGDSMIEYGISPGDLLTVDSSITPRPGRDVVANVDGEVVVKRYQIQNGLPYLCSSNPRYAPIPLMDREYQILGVVTHVVRNCQ